MIDRKMHMCCLTLFHILITPGLRCSVDKWSLHMGTLKEEWSATCMSEGFVRI